MMQNDSKAILDDLLGRWHQWSRAFKVVSQRSADPMFRNARTSKGWDSVSDIVDEEISASLMESIDFEVSEMQDPHRSAIHEVARNCATGYQVWRSPRLPVNPAERAAIVVEARQQLTKRLMDCGVI